MRTGWDSRLASLIASFAVVLLLATPAFTQDCPELVGSLMGPGLSDVAVSSGYAYATGDPWGSGERSLRVIEVSDPYHPVEVGSIDFDPGWPTAVAVSGSYAYVAGVTPAIAGLFVIDVSAPSAPVQVGFVGHAGGGRGWDVAVSGDYAYVVTQGAYGTLSVIDVSTPSAPVLVGSLWGGGGYGVAVSGGYAYVAAGDGLAVIDVSEPSAPGWAGELVPVGGWGVAVSGGYAYTAGGYSDYFPMGLYVIDVSEPSAPVEVGFLGTPTATCDVAVSRGYAYVAVNEDYRSLGAGLHVIDVSIPSAPVEVGSYATVGGGLPGYWEGVAVSDGYVFLVNLGGLFIFRECGPLFADGFESGDTSAWSATVP